jgi:hypothetical protein
LRGERIERREGRASGHIGCKSHFHTWLIGSEFESGMWMALVKICQTGLDKQQAN